MAIKPLLLFAQSFPVSLVNKVNELVMMLAEISVKRLYLCAIP